MNQVNQHTNMSSNVLWRNSFEIVQLNLERTVIDNSKTQVVLM